jgi:hypothetical protein
MSVNFFYSLPFFCLTCDLENKILWDIFLEYLVSDWKLNSLFTLHENTGENIYFCHL